MFGDDSYQEETTTKKGDKRLKMENYKFRSTQHFKRYKEYYIKATIIQERFVDLVDLKVLGNLEPGW